VFYFQAANNLVYNQFLNYLAISPAQIKKVSAIPFLPISFFKNDAVCVGNISDCKIFTSSGTTGIITSKHFVRDVSIYETSFLKAFELFYGSPEDYAILALLPSYLEREGSSLVYMCNKLIELSKSSDSGFYLYNTDALIEKINQLALTHKKIFLIGVSYALLDLADKNIQLPANCILMETGGMKGKRKEISRMEVNEILRLRLKPQNIFSEYGMTELLSQSWTKSDGYFYCPPWMQVSFSEPEDLLSASEKRGCIRVTDLANMHSCSFIETRDLGTAESNLAFSVAGRMDNSVLRGCNLLWSE
jgi:hypothetical protein